MTYIVPSMLVLFATLGAAPGDVDDATRAAFLREYAAASAKIQAVYDQLRIDVKQINPDGSEELWAYARSGTSTRRVGGDLKTGTATAIVVDLNHSFILHRIPGADAYQVTSQAKAPATMESYMSTSEIRSLPAFTPFRLPLERPVSEFLADKNCSIKAIARIGAAPNRVVRVDWEMAAAKPGQQANRYGTFEFLVDAHWAIKSYSTFSSAGAQNRVTGETYDLGRGADLEYRGEHQGVPLVQRITTWTSGRIRRDGSIYEVTKVVPGPVPKSEFAIESFPIAAPLAPAAKR